MQQIWVVVDVNRIQLLNCSSLLGFFHTCFTRKLGKRRALPGSFCSNSKWPDLSLYAGWLNNHKVEELRENQHSVASGCRPFPMVALFPSHG